MGNSDSWFKKNPKKTLLFVYVLFLILLELGLQLYNHVERYLQANHVTISHITDRYNELVHHDYLPNIQFITYSSKYDSHKPVPNTINSFGIRGPEIKDKKFYRVLNVGDSFIQADEVSYEKTFGEKLNAHFKDKIEFISHGFSSWSPTIEFSWIFHKGMKLNPDEINLFLCINDFYRGNIYVHSDQAYRKCAVYEGNIPVKYIFSQNDEKKPSLTWIEKTKYFLTYNIQLIKLFKKFYAKIRYKYFESLTIPNEIILLSKNTPTWPKDLKENVDETIGVVLNLNQYLKRNKVKLNVLMVPIGFRWKNEIVYGKQADIYGWNKDFTVNQLGIENYLTDILKEEGVTYISLSDKFNEYKVKNPKVILFYKVDGHWNNKGHKLIYEILKNYYTDD